MPAVTLSVVTVAVLAFAYGPLLTQFGLNLWAKTHYQHFPFVIAASLILFVQRLVTSRRVPAGNRDRRSWLGYTAAWLVLLAAYAFGSPMLSGVSLILFTGAWGHAQAVRLGRAFPVGPWMLLWLIIPPPGGLDRQIIEGLQRTSSSLASKALDLTGVNHLMDGNTLVLLSKQLFVDEACSGIISVVSIVACAAIFGVWRNRAPLHIALMMAAAAGWAMLLNVVRITSIALAEVWRQWDWTEGTPHTLIALAAFAVAIIALVATDWLLKSLLAPIGPRWKSFTGEPIRFGAPIVSLWDATADPDETLYTSDGDIMTPSPRRRPQATRHPVRWRELLGASRTGVGQVIPVLAFGALALTQFAWDPLPERGEQRPVKSIAMAAKLEESVMPERLEGLTLVDVRQERRPKFANFGEYSVIYEYSDANEKRFMVSCDFPFGGWHELSVCYQGIGWRLKDRTVAPVPRDKSEKGYESAQLELTKPNGDAALVLFCASRSNGEAVVAQRSSFWERVVQELATRRAGGVYRETFQTQVLAVRDGGITDRDRRLAALLLDTARERFTKVANSVN